MNVEDVLRGKSLGSGESGPVATIRPDNTVADVVAALREQNIGALVVSSDGSHVDGIISERDIVRLLGEGPAPVLERAVSEVMSTNVRTCSMTDQLAELAQQMTVNRIRHLIVASEGRMVGIVSIGDVVKRKIEETEQEASALREYIAS